MTKRAHHEGSIYQRADTGRWLAALTLPDGRRVTRSAGTQREARAKLAELQRLAAEGKPLAVDRQTVAAYFADWLPTAEARLRPSTYLRHSQYVKLHTLPTLGRLALASLSAQHLQRLYAAKLAEGLAPLTVRHLHDVIHVALAQAVKWGVLIHNPAAGATPPRAATLEMQTFTAAQAQAFLDAARSDRLEALYVLALTTGMRRGEMLALQWANVDLEHKTLRVVAAASQVGSQMIFGEPKNKSGRRQIILTTAAVAALRAHKARQAAERLKAGAHWVDQGLVFTDVRGGVVRPYNLARRSYGPLLVAAGVPKIRFHDLRHTAATLLLSRGVHPKIVSEMLGHSNIAMTMDLYSHVTSAMHAEAARIMDDILTANES